MNCSSLMCAILFLVLYFNEDASRDEMSTKSSYKSRLALGLAFVEL